MRRLISRSVLVSLMLAMPTEIRMCVLVCECGRVGERRGVCLVCERPKCGTAKQANSGVSRLALGHLNANANVKHLTHYLLPLPLPLSRVCGLWYVGGGAIECGDYHH